MDNKQKTFKKLFMYGNSKLPKTTAVFSLGSAKYCPSRQRGLCLIADVCYARKAEIQYERSLPYRIRQLQIWDDCEAEEFAYRFLKSISKKRIVIDTLRFNESGDFRSNEDVRKMVIIANILKTKGISTYVYTARKDLNLNHLGSLVVNCSGFRVDGTNEFTAVKEFSGENIKCLADCKKCRLCTVLHNKKIEVLIH